MKVAAIQSAFNWGEFSPLMHGQVRFERYDNALALCENYIPLIQGGLTRRPGTYFVSAVKNSAKKTRLVRFEFSTTQAYIIEFGDQYLRFYMDHGQILSGGSPYEIASPYLEADLFELSFTQSADVLYIVHPNYAPRKLSRSGHTNWTLSVIDFLDGPYLPTNGTATTLTPSATTGNGITITASTNVFAPTDVGRLVRIQHTSTWGYAKIVGYTSPTQVTADVKSDFGAITAVTTWRLGVWSGTTGYPACVTFYEDRLFFGGNLSYPTRIDGSKSGDYENFAPTKTDGTVANDNAVAFSLNSNTVDSVRWLMGDEKGLLIGTVGGEWIMRPSSQSEALSPTNISAKPATPHGSAPIQPLRVGKSTLFVQRAGRKLRDYAYVFEVDGFRAPDVTVYAEHITKTGLVELAYQQEPIGTLWAPRTDGTLLTCLFNREQDAIGWARQIVGGSFSGGQAVVESVASIPAPSGSYDEVWMIVKRTVNGATVRYVEYLTKLFNTDDGDKVQDAFFVDSGLTYSGAPATVISGLTHLEGQTVSILADGSSHPDRTVTGGQLTLARSASKVHVGLAYQSNGRTLKYEVGAADGTAQGKTQRIHRIAFRLHETVGFLFGPDENNLDEITFRVPENPMDQPVPLFTGDKIQEFPGGYARGAQIYFRQYQPLPGTLLGVYPQMVTYD